MPFMSRELPTSPPGHFGVFTSRAAAADGWSAAALLHAVKRGRITRLTHGVYVPSDLLADTGPDADRRRMRACAIAATLALTGAVASHTSSALLSDLPTWTVPERPCVTVAPRVTGNSRCAHLHRASIPPEHVETSGLVVRTVPARTIFDTAREHGLEDAVVMGDDAWRRGMIDMPELEQVAEYCGRWPGSRRARQALQLLDPRSESPLESVSRLRLLATRLPPPDLQPRIYDLSGRFLGRPDFYWDEYGVAGEVDGKLKYAENANEVVWREKRRQQGLEDTGVLFVRWGMPDLRSMPALVHRIETVLTRGARRSSADRGWIVRRTVRDPLTLPGQCG